MKKIYMILIPVLLLTLTGCFEKTKTLVCTRDNETTNNVLISSTVNVEYDGDKLINFKLETVTDLSKSNLLNDDFVDSLIRTSKDTSSKYEGKSGIEANYEKVDVGVKYTLKVSLLFCFFLICFPKFNVMHFNLSLKSFIFLSALSSPI